MGLIRSKNLAKAKAKVGVPTGKGAADRRVAAQPQGKKGK